MHFKASENCTSSISTSFRALSHRQVSYSLVLLLDILVTSLQPNANSLLQQRPEVLSVGFLADYIVSRRMFVFFLPHMCSPGPQQILFRTIVSEAYLERKQLRVMGYSIENEV